jgi:hypothetical protein
MSIAPRSAGVLLLSLMVAGCEADGVPLAPEAPLLESTLPTPFGTLELCKETSGGIAQGSIFDYTVTFGSIPRHLAVAVGGCLELLAPRGRPL